jgi:hypothetical protein
MVAQRSSSASAMEYRVTFDPSMQLGFGLHTNKTTGEHSVDYGTLSPGGQAAQHNVKEGHQIISIGSTAITRSVSHADIIQLLKQASEPLDITFRIPQPVQQQRQTKTLTISEGKRIGILSEGRDGQIAVVNLVVGGQGHDQNCELGDVIVGK